MKRMAWAILTGLSVSLMAKAAFAEQKYQVFESKKYGYSLKIPVEFKMDGKEDKTTSWLYQPGSSPTPSAPAAEEGGKKKKGLGKLAKGALGGIAGGLAKDASAPAADAGGGQPLESALTIYVNWVWMKDVSSGTLFDTNKKSDTDNIGSPDPDYKDLVVFSKKGGYAMDGSAYWIKEVDKDDPSEIHRWHIKAFGNSSSYTIGLCGTYRQFEKWAPVYEEIVKSFKLIPIESK